MRSVTVGYQNVGGPHGFHEFCLAKRPVTFIEARFKQFAHPGFDHIRKFPGHNDDRLLFRHTNCLSGFVEESLTPTDSP